MKILVVTNMFPTARDPSFGCFVKSQIESLQKRGLSVDLIFVNGRASKLNYVRGAWRVFRKSFCNNYDLVHAHYGLSGLMARCQWRSPVVVSFCGSDVMDRIQGRISRLVSLLADCSIVKSQRLGRALGTKKLHIVPSGLDFSLFQPLDRVQAGRVLKFSPRTRHILFVGDPIRKVKRFDVARQTLQIVRSHLETPVELIALHGRPQKEVAQHMTACDVLLVTSDWEGSPNAVKEAMACNLPIVSTDVGDVREIAGQTKHCFICPQDPQILARNIIAILQTGARTDGRKSVLSLSLENIASEILSLYMKIIR